MKFLRSYEIRILTPENELIKITPPFSISFTITRNTLASVNSCSLTLINMPPSIRSKLFKDRYTFSEYWQLVIVAGYLKTGKGSAGLKTVFQGNINESVSFKQGTEYITKIDAYDGLFAVQNGFTSTTISKNTNKKSIVETIIKDMPNVIQGSLGSSSEGSSPRGQVLMGQSNQVLDSVTGGNYFIDNEVVNVLDPDEYIGVEVILIDSDQLKTTPRRRETFIDCETLFIPEVQIGLLAELRSQIKEYNGQYKIMGFVHSFEVKGNESGNSNTTINLYAGENVLRSVS
jgi:hypothetical protein